ncbi:hypothetical protein GW17_00057959 [Ensete ventricosum]|uniref:Uncharacterized protein n=1 Tax=Ensete ventricosum TaxID=4639 RepID=A0A426Y134_ENSVE|nr:hypothetical protein B296_00044847 [Ensete ventricosum]RWV80718.1 hypothetical protein GW17_00057959 [Ensete ventricosum]RZS10946.1 hypothetical protein BHM03_00042216 [Ensete ventricosum]
MATNVSTVYIHVVDDVISKVREEFINYGVGEGVLNELQACGAIGDSVERSSLPKNAAPIPVRDLNVPYEGPTEEYETPTAEMLFPPQPPSPWMNQRPLGVDVNVGKYKGFFNIKHGLCAYVDGREEPDRGSSHQPMTQDFFMNSAGKRKRDDYASHLSSGGYIPQQDGSGDVMMEFSLTQMFHLQEVPSEDYNTPGEHGKLIVTRTKSRWKCNLKDGIMHLNNRDFLFNKVLLHWYQTD